MNIKEWNAAFLAENVGATDGHDAGPIIDEFLAYCGLGPGNAWCAATQSYCGHKAMHDAGVNPADPWFKTASSQQMKRLAEAKGKFFTDPQHLLNCKGAIAGWTDPDGAHGHIMLVIGRLTDAHGKVVAIKTIEGNSDTRPHNEIASIVRDCPVTQTGHALWFIDISDVPGCAYW